MTAGPAALDTSQGSQVADLIQSLVKALRAFQMYLPNNPIYQRAVQNVAAAFGPVWELTDELVLTIAETDFVWEQQVVYRQPSKTESLAWGLFKDGMRSLTIKRGAEEAEVPRLLDTINRARFLAADASDDLLTLLWEQEFQSIHYHFVEFLGDGGPLPEASGPPAGTGDMTAEQRRRQAAEEAPPRAPGVVDIDDFDSTVYFLDEGEIDQIAREVEQEYKRDVRESALNALFDLVELEQNDAVRADILDILEQLFPNLLNARDFRTAAAVLRETKLLRQRAAALGPAVEGRLDHFVSRLSEPAIVTQLLQSLDEASTVARDTDVADVLHELRASALEPLIAGLPALASEELRGRIQDVVDRVAAAYPAEVLRLLRESRSAALAGVVGLCGRLRLMQAVSGLGETLNHADSAVRLGTVQALNQLGTPGALTLLDKAIDDVDRGVRLAAVRAAGTRGYKGALRRVEAVVLGKGVKEMDLTEKMAFFEAYGAIAGPPALKALEGILLPRGLLKMKQSPETRACAAIAIGRIRGPEARELLVKASEDRELVVRTAASRALREVTA